MSNAFTQLGINPFENDIINAPNEVSFSVAGLNDKPLNQLIAEFEGLTKGALPRPPVKAPRAQLVISPDAGYGKSHLLGRLFERLGERATLVYLRPFQAPQKAWHSILLTTVQALKSGIRSVPQIRSQLDAFALGVLAHLAADYLADRHVENAGLNSALNYVREHPLKMLAPGQTNKVLIDWLKSALDDRTLAAKLAHLLHKRDIDLHGRENAWLKVLGTFAFAESLSLEREAALKWIRGEPLEDDELAILKLQKADNEGKGDSSAQEINDLCFRRLRGLCALSAYFRPVVFCFDQTEYYGADKELVGALGQCIECLFAEVPNQLTIVTANANNWNDDLLPKLASPHRARLSPSLELEGIKLNQAKELMTRRLSECGSDDAAVGKFLNGNWLDSQFRHDEELGVRKLLSAAAQHYRTLANHSKAQQLSLTDLFRKQTNEIRAKEALHQYNQDCLIWFAQELVKGYDGVTVTKPINKYFSVSWDWPDRSIFFAFEESDNSSRWRAIASEARSLSERAGKRVSTIVFRTPDLGKIPKPTWIRIRPQIDAAVKKGLRIVELELDDVCELHAAREFYSNALQGNVDYAVHEVMSWLKEHFVDWFEKYSKPILGEAPLPPPVAPPPSPSIHDLSEAQLEVLTTTVRRFRLVDIKQVWQEFGSVSFQPAILRAVEQHPNLKAHPGPQTIYLQWRHGV
ncbi:MAG: hypothetical protein ACLQIQ_21970 [Beijerinckiaceae bacterium]